MLPSSPQSTPNSSSQSFSLKKGKRKLFLDHFNAPNGLGQSEKVLGGWRGKGAALRDVRWAGKGTEGVGHGAGHTFINIERRHHLNKKRYLIIIVTGHAT